ncbi:MAG: YdcF family protein, partial [Eggerthellaceae bacterium]|nr:YdcF family protein [Eggerthellaceae bacterium]
PDRIIREDKSTNTSENIRNSMAFIDPANDRIAIVTNDYHLFRSMAIARKQGITHVSGIAAGATPWYLPNNMARESFGLAKDFVFGTL